MERNIKEVKGKLKGHMFFNSLKDKSNVPITSL